MYQTDIPASLVLPEPLYLEVFNDALNGTPDNITKTGCLALARLGKEAWNSWRQKYPVLDNQNNWQNNADFNGIDFRCCESINFTGFEFGDGANFSEAKFLVIHFTGAQFGHTANLNPCSYWFKGWPPHFRRVFLKKPTTHRNLNVVHQTLSRKNQSLQSHCRHC